MSGTVAIFNRDGAPVDRDLLCGMASFLAFRGPDAQEIWIDGGIGFGHALLRTTWEASKEKQPCTLGGQVWITADVRLDGRSDLIRNLNGAGRHPSEDASDPELILNAYHCWNEQCLDRLIGDFSFAIWDGRKQLLFCARDQMGIKPFYYSQTDGVLIYSNTLNCIRLDPAVSSELNDAAVADFLVHGSKRDPAATTFRDIQRLPAGHYLVCSAKEFRVSRYWTLPVTDPVFYKRAGDYVEHFKALLRSAVADRLRTDRVGVFMSGGLDSPGLAVTAREVLSAQASPYELRAHTLVYDWLVPDDERHYAGLVAKGLGIPIEFLAGDEYQLYERWDQPELRTPEPAYSPQLVANFDLFKQISHHSRVAFYGEGPDNALYYEWPVYFMHLAKTKRWGWLLRSLKWHASLHREAPLIGGLGNRLRQRLDAEQPEADLGWIRPGILKLASRDLPAGRGSQVHPFHPVSYQCMTRATWAALAERYDPGSTWLPLEVRYPYLDIRLVQYLVAVPRVPWCRNKYLFRSAFRNVLPEPVLQRPKAPLRGHPALERAKISGVPPWVPEPALFQYLDPTVVDTVLRRRESISWDHLRAVSLNFFLAFKESDIREYRHGAAIHRRTARSDEEAL